MSYVTATDAAAPVPSFPAGTGMHWEKEIRRVWNVRECADEEQELIYEISWIAELGAWRRFLRSRRKVHK